MKGEAFSWENAPLPEAKRRLAELETLVREARITVSKRENNGPKVYTCWSQSHLSLVPEKVLAKCIGTIPDGKEAYRDDSLKDENGIITPVRVCSYLCFRCFQDYSNQLKLERLSKR